MDVKVGTIISRFAFSLPSLYDGGSEDHDIMVSSPDEDDTEESCGVACTSGTHCAEARTAAKATQTNSGSHATRCRAAASPTEKVGVTGACAFVSDSGVASSASLAASSSPSYIIGCAGGRGNSGRSTVETLQHGVRDRRGGAMQFGASLHLPDLVQLAARTWNVELYRGPTGAASHCVLRLPPVVVGGTIYRGPVVYVLASGVVRMATYGSVAATEVLARHIRDILHEACKPLAMRRAAREELLLMRAVLDDSSVLEDASEEEEGARRLSAAVPEAGINVSRNDMSLSTALAGGAATRGQDRRRTAFGSSSTNARIGPLPHDTPGDGRPTSASTPSALCSRACVIDFLQAVATPRWDEIAGLRASLFTPASATPRVPVRRASVNVCGDAPMEWWRWYLNVQDNDPDVGRGDNSEVAGSGRAPTSAAAAATLNSAKPCLGERCGVPQQGPFFTGTATERERAGARGSNKTAGFWTCAAYADASPPHAAKFVQFLQRRRALLAHHVASFRLRRQATQNSIQILLNWRAVSPPSPPTPLPLLSAAAAPLVGRLPLARALEQPTAMTQPLPDSVTPSAPTVPISTNTSGNAWVTEASAANFFMESTFIAESTAPYGLDGVRMPTDLSSPADTALPASKASDEGNREKTIGGAALTADGGRDGVPASFEPHVGDSVLRHDTSRCKGDKTAIKAAPEKRRRGVVTAQTPAAKRDEDAAAAAAMEHVTCIIYRTGRVQMTAASELALRQMCATLLIPFLVATAEMEL
ncbi:hypothetical protein, conserved [Leishmania tarentolae]|uniref:Uncharacterized protein n=1 Tax=Leishmania tarentolae TaxID=5689 RepID=A0A640KA10_LEITA|nr:hypothetical protein, conserved [Leishmania tarentolae]